MELLRLREILGEKKISGKLLADRLGLTPASVSNIVQGNSFPKPETLLKIAEVLEVDVKDLFNSTKTKETEDIYVRKDGVYLKIGELIKA